MTKISPSFFIAIGYSTDFLMRSIVTFKLTPFCQYKDNIFPTQGVRKFNSTEDGSVQLILCTQELRKRQFLPLRTK